MAQVKLLSNFSVGAVRLTRSLDNGRAICSQSSVGVARIYRATDVNRKVCSELSAGHAAPNAMKDMSELWVHEL